MLFGYARISTPSQKFDLQIDALLKAGVKEKNIYKDVSSEAKANRKSLDLLLSKLREEDVVIVWNMACKHRKIKLPLVFHSDRGVQYASDRFRKKLKAYKLIKQSMSRKGNCWDNAIAESFFKSLKVEVIYPYRFTTRNQAKLVVFEYIEAWDNQNRRHTALGGLTIKEFEKYNQLKQVA